MSKISDKNTNDKSLTLKDIQNILFKKTDLEKPIDYYKYDINPSIVHIYTGDEDSEFEQTDDTNTLDIKFTDTSKKTNDSNNLNDKEPIESEKEDISNYDTEKDDIDSLLNYLPTEEDTIDDDTNVVIPDDSKYDTNVQAYTRNPYISTLIFMMPSLFMLLIILGMRGMLSFSTLVTILISFGILWYIISLIVNYSNTNAPTQTLFSLDGSINQGASNASFFNAMDTVLKAFDKEGGIINGIFNFVNYFVSYFQESLQIINIRKLYFLLTLSLTMMCLLFIITRLFSFI